MYMSTVKADQQTPLYELPDALPPHGPVSDPWQEGYHKWILGGAAAQLPHLVTTRQFTSFLALRSGWLLVELQHCPEKLAEYEAAAQRRHVIRALEAGRHCQGWTPGGTARSGSPTRLPALFPSAAAAVPPLR